jgi:hypothetical protein
MVAVMGDAMTTSQTIANGFTASQQASASGSVVRDGDMTPTPKEVRNLFGTQSLAGAARARLVNIQDHETHSVRVRYHHL